MTGARSRTGVRRKPVACLLAAALLISAPAAAGQARGAALDRSFDGRGFLEAPGIAEWVGSAPDPGHRAAIYPGGRIVVGGYSFEGFSVYRFLPDGRPDLGFGERGMATVTLPGDGGESGVGPFGHVSAIAVQPDGRILVGGLFTPNPPRECRECSPEYQDPREHAAIARLNPDGSLDTRFGGSRRGGRHQGVRFLSWRGINAIAVRRGRILHAGARVEGEYEFGEAGYVGRMRLDGRPDRSFGAGGEVELPRVPDDPENAGSSVAALRFDRRGRIYAAGYDRGRVMLVRLGRDGDPDRSFGRGGFVRSGLAAPACGCAWGQGLARDGRGRLLVSGYVQPDERPAAIGLARYLPAGRLDRSFGRRGLVRTSVGKGDAYGVGAAVQRNGRIVVAGASAGRGLGSFTVVRYRPDGGLDRSFFGNGVFRAPLRKRGDRAMQPLIERSGRLVVAGEFMVARFR